MDVFQTRQMIKELGNPNVNQETVDKWNRIIAEQPEKEGEVEKLVKSEAEGRKISTNYRGQTVNYWVPRDAAWASGRQITVEKAYRIVSEDEKTMELREVYGNQIEAVKQGYLQEIKRILGKK